MLPGQPIRNMHRCQCCMAMAEAVSNENQTDVDYRTELGRIRRYVHMFITLHWGQYKIWLLK